jgi:hypothetical protein
MRQKSREIKLEDAGDDRIRVQADLEPWRSEYLQGLKIETHSRGSKPTRTRVIAPVRGMLDLRGFPVAPTSLPARYTGTSSAHPASRAAGSRAPYPRPPHS